MERSATLLDSHVAGLSFGEAREVWQQMQVGDRIILRHEPLNPHDCNAVLVMFHSQVFGDDYKLGYVPRDRNRAIAALLDMGWGDLLDPRISEKSPTGAELRIIVKIARRHQF